MEEGREARSCRCHSKPGTGSPLEPPEGGRPPPSALQRPRGIVCADLGQARVPGPLVQQPWGTPYAQCPSPLLESPSFSFDSGPAPSPFQHFLLLWKFLALRALLSVLQASLRPLWFPLHARTCTHVSAQSRRVAAEGSRRLPRHQRCSVNTLILSSLSVKLEA